MAHSHILKQLDGLQSKNASMQRVVADLQYNCAFQVREIRSLWADKDRREIEHGQEVARLNKEIGRGQTELQEAWNAYADVEDYKLLLDPGHTRRIIQDLPVERLDLLIDRIEVVATIVHAMRVEVANRDRPQEEDAASVNSTVTIAGEVSAVVN